MTYNIANPDVKIVRTYLGNTLREHGRATLHGALLLWKFLLYAVPIAASVVGLFAGLMLLESAHPWIAVSIVALIGVLAFCRMIGDVGTGSYRRR